MTEMTPGHAIFEAFSDSPVCCNCTYIPWEELEPAIQAAWELIAAAVTQPTKEYDSGEDC